MSVLLTGIPTDDFLWEIKYKLVCDSWVNEEGDSCAYRKFAHPCREMVIHLGNAGNESFAFFNDILQAGLTYCTVPIWPLRTSLVSGVSAGVHSELQVHEVGDFREGEYVWIVNTQDPSINELKTISTIAGSTISLTSTVSYSHNPITWPTPSSEYDPLGAWVIPTMHGLVECEEVDFVDGLPGYNIKLKVDGGAWTGCTMPTEVPLFYDEPAETHYTAPKTHRKVFGSESGVLSMYVYTSSTKIGFECKWHYKGTGWRKLLELFLSVKGKEDSFYLPTGLYEVTAQRGSDKASTTIYLDEGYVYFQPKFPKLRARSRQTNSQFTVWVLSHVGGDEYTCLELEHEIKKGDRLSYFPLVKFVDDEITFTFRGIQQCEVSASFLEVTP